VLLGFQFRTIVINNKRKDIVFRIFSSWNSTTSKKTHCYPAI
jgi:hypothetical protein